MCALMAAVSGGRSGAAELAAPPGADEFVGCKKYPADKKFKWSVRGEVGVAELAASLGKISCRPIVVATAVAARGGKVVLEVPDLVTAADVYRLFYGALEAMGFTVDASGGAIKVVDSGRAREVASPQLDGALANDDHFVVRLLHPKHAAPQELAEVLGKMKSKDGDVSVFGASALVITDRAGNVRRMEELARALDVGESGARVFTLATHGQTPTELAGALEKILGAASHRSAAPTDKGAKPTGAALDADVRALVPLDQAHLLAVIGSDAGFARVQAVALRLDPPADDGSASQGHVLNLANTNAEDMATTLQSVGLGSRSAVARPTGGAGGGASASAVAAGGALPLSGDVRIGADKTANALVVFANASDFAMVRDLVEKLDVPRRQVYVEAVILDLSVDKTRDLGVSWHQTGNVAGNAAFAANASTALASVDAKSIAAAATGAGLTAGIVGQAFQIFGQDVPSFAVVLHALERSKDANIISRPHLLTMDNVKASLSVGQTIQFPTQSGQSLGTATPTLFNTFTPRDVALKLELTPHLNDSTSIRLEINGEISDLAADATLNTGGGPATNKRTVQTAVVVRDGESVVLGGLTKETDTQAIEKVPFLGDIPLLGRLFQTRTKSRGKQDLLIVLTPYIIRGPADLRRIQERKEAERREFIERYTAFTDQGQYDAHVDYTRKRGLLEEINLTAEAAALDAEAQRAAERALKPRRADGAIALEPAN
ncbi:MAG: ral secretion pathway protein [Myxococcales bacterium]|nr:ral secretion pathway protein [Myxococcales bacterium]